MAPEKKKAVVELKGVEKAFGSQQVLRGLDLEVFEKETLVVIGRSGGGKSVTIKHIVGLEAPDKGSVHVFGQEISSLARKEQARTRLRMGYLFQSSALLNLMTIGQHAELP